MPKEKAGFQPSLETGFSSGAPGESRIPDIILRADTIYPTELPRPAVIPDRISRQLEADLAHVRFWLFRLLVPNLDARQQVGALRGQRPLIQVT
ncbi:MAG: hypothetical protein VKP62_11670 [Candidatus Sericytochromatia bacterium]|nr:hypothetical protein [Candidatus Sericytochromatia bacterium]